MLVLGIPAIETSRRHRLLQFQHFQMVRQVRRQNIVSDQVQAFAVIFRSEALEKIAPVRIQDAERLRQMVAFQNRALAGVHVGQRASGFR